MGYLNELLSRNPLVIDGDTIRPHHNYTDDLYTGGKKQMNNYKNMCLIKCDESELLHNAKILCSNTIEIPNGFNGFFSNNNKFYFVVKNYDDLQDIDIKGEIIK